MFVLSAFRVTSTQPSAPVAAASPLRLVRGEHLGNDVVHMAANEPKLHDDEFVSLPEAVEDP
ncbi:hypothetical protein ACGFIG_14575 [Micromonospora sp. NPDC049048]|uniref:hypothetical protein n=1 Tax=Micromonospora sp. NPDC049048 TaxID=3364263 RepID=UPI0037134EB5